MSALTVTEVTPGGILSSEDDTAQAVVYNNICNVVFGRSSPYDDDVASPLLQMFVIRVGSRPADP